MNDKHDRSPDHGGPAAPHVQGSATEGSHLAHWPPPKRDHAAKPVIKGHEPNEPAQQAKWHLTRGIVSKFDDG